MEVFQKEKLSVKFEGSEVVYQLEEQLEMKEVSIQKLVEYVQSFRDERDLIRQRFQELMDRVVLFDGDIVKFQEKLRGREVDYQSLEYFYRRVVSQFQSVYTLLKDKEEELKYIKEVYEKVLEKKDQDFNEVLVKMVVLGSSLEEIEMKFQVKEEILRKFVKEVLEDVQEFQSFLGEVEEDGVVFLGLQF